MIIQLPTPHIHQPYHCSTMAMTIFVFGSVTLLSDSEIFICNYFDALDPAFFACFSRAPVCVTVCRDVKCQTHPSHTVGRMASASAPRASGRPAGTSRLVSQARNIVLHVFKYFKDKEEKTEEALKKTSEATKVSQALISKIRLQGKRSVEGVIKSPAHYSRLASVLGGIDNFDREAIRREVLSFYERGELPTLDSLLERIKEPPINYKGARTSLWKLLKSMGFKYKKHSSSRAILMERSDIVAARTKFLRELRKNRRSENPRPEIYLDETWVNQNIAVQQCWTNKEGTIGPRTKTGKGGRFIVVHAGGSEGFVPNALLMFRSKFGNKGDYHDSMNNETFKKWFLEQLLPNIPSRSLIIMDNAPYHSKQINKAPTGVSRKAEVIQWLTENNIPHEPTYSRSELYELVKSNKNSKLRYEIDELAATYGHQVLRLPPYYCQFNPIENIWAQIKEEIKKKNSNDKQQMKAVEELTRQAVHHVTQERWKKCVDHAKMIQEDYMKKDLAFDHMMEILSIDLSQSDSDSSDESDAL